MKTIIETYGCALNQADSEQIHGLLRQHGLEDSDVIIVNTCTVKSPTETKILRKLRELDSQGMRVVVTGCLPAARPDIADEFPTFSFIGTNVSAIVEAVGAAACGERYVNIADPADKVCLPEVKANPVVGIVPIAEGCLGACTYCQTKAARGVLRSYSVESLVGRVGRLVSEGAVEVWLTAQDTGAYGHDIGVDLPELLKRVSDLDGDFMARVGMMNPDHTLKMLDDLIDAYACEKIYKFAHIPVQAGSDRVLEDMGRRYTSQDFADIVERFRSEHEATISTDVILGYPTETGDEFQETVDLIREVKPDVLNVSRYWPRPGTPAASLPQLPGRETKRRSRIIGELFQETGAKVNERWVGWEGECIVSKANEDGTYTARNKWYKPIIVKGKELIGKKIEVKVTNTTYYDLRGEVTSPSA
ncbi:tRNA (N(6)-L-threonylcarbamoyladenosine(37)-C(2))-methylthiotransferase [Candidatus Altiarchaeota archaeon]